ncbi:hypothetical protein [Marinicella meishanensis]|uniref:hypothetical protein n=1 Tax=Marinicella meishanensis TaxID=2873263 RepID=UPI001CBFADB8|nr:hypothetical protein [Marinicella sp. NBU2979]
MSQNLENDVFVEMLNWGFVDPQNQFKQGMLMNDDGKRLFIKQVYPNKSPSHIDLFMQYAHVVSVDGQLKCDPAVVLGFDLKNQRIYPVLYRNDLLDHTIHVYEDGALSDDNAEWLLKYWSDWLNELSADDYDYLNPPQKVAMAY